MVNKKLNLIVLIALLTMMTGCVQKPMSTPVITQEIKNEEIIVAGGEEEKTIKKPIIIEKPPLLAKDILERDYFTFDEAKKVIEILDYEASIGGKVIELRNIHGKKDLLNKLVSELEKRAVVEEKIDIAGVDYNQQDYLFIRSTLFNKLKK